MTKYLITYHGLETPKDPELMEKAKAAFGAWLQKAGNAVLDPGAPTHFSGDVPSSGMQIEIGGYSILQTETLDEVVGILKSHPFVSRGGTLQINEIMVI